MTVALVRKELRQHGWALLLLGALAFAGWLAMAGAAFLQGKAASAFDGVRDFVLVMVPLSSLVLCHRLVVTEYRGRTQLFLEGLPVRRWQMLAVKYGLGWLALLLLVSLPMAAATLQAWQREALTPQFVTLLAGRAFSAAWCAYNFFFLMGLLGRYRLALYLALFLCGMAVHELSSLELDRFGPMELLDARFAYERQEWPWAALRATWGLGTVFLLLAWFLGLTREGSVAALLAEKMTHREKVFLAALLVGLVSAVALLTEKKQKQPFDLHGAVFEQRPGVAVKVASGARDNEEAARLLARFLATELAAAGEYLQVERWPPVFITRRRDLDPHRYERGELEAAEGIHAQANFGAPDWSQERFLAWLVREALVVHTGGRAQLEPRRWVLDGFGPFWAARDRQGAPLGEDRILALRALYGAGPGLAESELRRWLNFREQVGDEIAAAVAWSGLKTLARRHGSAPCRDFVRAVLGGAVHKDFRALLQEWRSPVEEQLRRHAGVDLPQLMAEWQEELAAARVQLEAELSGLPRLRGQVRFVPLSAQSRTVRYRVEIDPAPTAQARYSFLYHLLPPFDEEVPRQSIRRETQACARPEGELPESCARGARLYWTFAVEVPALDGEVISGWVREEVP